MAAVLGDKRLHEFIGGRPDSLAELRERYARLAAGSPEPGEVWLNWIVRRRADDEEGTEAMRPRVMTGHDGEPDEFERAHAR